MRRASATNTTPSKGAHNSADGFEKQCERGNLVRSRVYGDLREDDAGVQRGEQGDLPAVVEADAQDLPGGAASERSPHWSTHAIAVPSAFALVSIAGYCSSSHARTAAGCCS
ncbi:hypothetical protein [Actinosynnema sp. NPDC023587]|uniref:hypothetical protein n=1 Tax=Actinosynnema sp. NPDC023587 TaxID=3154695 RepID=UPI0033C89A82